WKVPSAISVRSYTPYYNSWSGTVSVTGTNSNCFYPSIAAYIDPNWYNKFALAWIDYTSLQKINYVEYDCDASYPYPTFSNSAQVSPTGWESNDRPSIAFVDGTYPAVAWESRNNIAEGAASVHERQKSAYGSGGSWGNITSYTLQTTNQLHPSIGTYAGNNEVALLWNDGTNVYTASYNGTSWGSASVIGSGTAGGTETSLVSATFADQIGLWKKSDNNLSIGTGGIQQKVVNGKGSGFAATGNQQLSVTGGGGLAASAPLPYKLNKHGIIELDSVPQLAQAGFRGMIAFEISAMNLSSNGASKKVGYFEEDTVATAGLTSAQRYALKSEPFTVTSNNDQFTLAGAYYAKAFSVPKKVSRLDVDDIAVASLKDAATDNIVKELWRVPLSRLLKATDTTDGEFQRLTVGLNGLTGRKLYLDVTMLAEPVIVDDYLLLNQQTQQMNAELKNGDKNNALVVTDYALYQNYPNPFNPATTITFDVPAASHVVIKIFNTLGQEVKTIADDDYTPGRHEITIDASHFSSGTYFYRMTAGRFTGTKSFAVVK
ncbi:MAG: T9SS type A sorting domain-containing protein, partial [Bacteroidota bacterium]|nr:T9SS type A sorting domain-containing protein [Bacteroidota bacterium]